MNINFPLLITTKNQLLSHMFELPINVSNQLTIILTQHKVIGTVHHHLTLLKNKEI